jgi:hypothetical protein
VTVASSSTAELTINQVVRNAFVLASLMSWDEQASGIQWENRAIFGRQMLENLIKSLETEGRLSRARRFYELTLVDGTSEYTLPEAIMDVYGDAMYVGPDEPTPADAEYPVCLLSMEGWQRLQAKSATGMPTGYFPYRGGTAIQVRLWPVPDEDEDGGIIRFQVYYLLANATDGAATVDLERFWTSYLTTELAAVLAEAAGLPTDKVMRLRAQAEKLMG